MSADNPRITEQPEQQADKHISRQQNNTSRARTIHLPRHPSLAPDIVQKNYAVTCRWHQPLDNRFAPSFANSTTACAIHLPRYSLLAQAFVRQTYKVTWKYRLLKPVQCYIYVAHTININASQPLQKMLLQPCSQTNKDCRTGIQKTNRQTILPKRHQISNMFAKSAPSLPYLFINTSQSPHQVFRTFAPRQVDNLDKQPFTTSYK